MRLACLDHGQRLPAKLKLGMMKLMSGRPAPDVVKTLQYRPEFFGKAFSAWTHQALRGPSDWTVGEREMFAAYTAKLNHCLF